MDFIFGTPNPGNNYVYVAGKPAVYIYNNDLLQILVPNLNGVAPINFSFASGEISITQADATTDGYLSSIDWNIFNNKAPINSPAFTGTPTAPTAAPGTNTDQIATTAFVLANAAAVTQPDKQIVYGTGTGLTSNSLFTFDNTLGSNTIARMTIGGNLRQGQIDLTAFGGGSLLRIEAGPQIYFSNFGGNGFIFRPKGAVETMRMINDDLLIGHTSSALGRLDVRRTTIGSSIYASNNSYNLGGSGPIVVSDGSGITWGIGFSPTSTGYFYFPSAGLYVHGYGLYGTFFESGNVTVPKKMLVGYNGYDGDISNTLLNVKFEVHGGERFTDLAGSGNRMVIADSTGKLSTQSIPSSASLTDTYIGFGDASNVLTGSSSFTYNSTSGAVTIGGSVFYNRDLQISKSSNTSTGIIIQNTSTGSLANEDIVLIESGSIYTQLGRNNTTVTGNFDGTNVAMGGSFFVINTQTSNDAPIFLRSSVNYSVIENTGTNMAVRHDATGWRLGPSSSIGTANTRPWEISGLVRLDNAYTFYTAPGEQSFVRIAPSQAVIGNYSTRAEFYGFSSQNIDLVVSNVSKFNITSTQLSSSLLTGTGDRMVESSSTGVITATKELIEDWITDSTVQTELEDVSNWDVLGDYIGPTLTDTYQSQKHYDANYLFIAVTDNNFIRIPRV